MSAPRCKVGDLCVVVGPCVTPGLLGRFVIIERLAIDGEELDGYEIVSDGKVGWICAAAVSGMALPEALSDGFLIHTTRRALNDEILRPIRPNDGEDESLSWARPVDAEATA